jgi:integrase
MPKQAKPRKRGDRWEINWLDGTGKRRWQSFDSFKDAQAALRKTQSEADLVRSGSAQMGQPDRTFAELGELWVDVKHRKRSIVDDRSRLRLHLLPAFGPLKLAEINPTRIARFERDLSRRLSVGTVQRVLALLKSMLRLAVEHGWIGTAPTVRLPKSEEVAYLWLRSDAEIARMLEAARRRGYPGLVEFYATAVYTGMRAGELCGLRWQDVDFERRLITVQRSFATTTKTAQIRRVPILDPLLPLLREWRTQNDRELVFPNEVGEMHARGARVMKQTYREVISDAGLPAIRFHDLRHTFASHWVLNGGDLFRLQKILGHATPVMTQRYAHLSPDAFKDDWDRFGTKLPEVPAPEDPAVEEDLKKVHWRRRRGLPKAD